MPQIQPSYFKYLDISRILASPLLYPKSTFPVYMCLRFQGFDINYAIGSVKRIVSGDVETLETSSVACYQILHCYSHTQSLWQIAPEKTDSSHHQKQTTEPTRTEEGRTLDVYVILDLHAKCH